MESLEDRQLPAVTVTLLNDGSTLSITGNSNNDRVWLTQNDDVDLFSVTWQEISAEPSLTVFPVGNYQSSVIKRIVVNLASGDDRFEYLLISHTMQWEKTLSIDLGAGNDTALIDASGDLFTILQYGWSLEPNIADLPAKLVIDVQGGMGTDTIDAFFGKISNQLTYRANGGTGNDYLSTQIAGMMSATSSTLIDQDGGTGNDRLWVDLGKRGIASGAVVTVNQRGSQGNDVLSINARLPVFGSLRLNQWGGVGDDKLNATAQFDWQSTGNVTVRSNGEAGNDQQTLQIKRDEVPPYVQLFAPMQPIKISAIVNGGLGRNSAWITPNVRTFLASIKAISWDIGQPVPLSS